MTKKKTIQVPLMLRVIRWVFPKLEMLSPELSARYFERLFFTPFRYTAPAKEEEALHTAHLFALTYEGKKIQCYQWGVENKPFVLVVHGWAGRATQFRKFIEPLQTAGYNVIGFDGPAHGKSEGKRTTIREFDEILKAISELKGMPAAVIAHSFGGGATFYAVANGWPLKKLVNIASPTIADLIIESYLKALGGSWKTGDRFKRRIEKKFGKPFEAYTTLHIVNQVSTDLTLMLVHDEEDRDVDLKHVTELLKIFPAHTLITRGLGHNRILKDEGVIQSVIDFIKKQ